jgi:hypothetical protein
MRTYFFIGRWQTEGILEVQGYASDRDPGWIRFNPNPDNEYTSESATLGKSIFVNREEAKRLVCTKAERKVAKLRQTADDLERRFLKD